VPTHGRPRRAGEVAIPSNRGFYRLFAQNRPRRWSTSTKAFRTKSLVGLPGFTYPRAKASDPSEVLAVMEEYAASSRKPVRNAVVHGCENGPSEEIRCQLQHDSQSGIRVTITEPGLGFNPFVLTDPAAAWEPLCRTRVSLSSDSGWMKFTCSALALSIRS